MVWGMVWGIIRIIIRGIIRLMDRDILYAKFSILQLYIIQSESFKSLSKTLLTNNKTGRHLNN